MDNWTFKKKPEMFVCFFFRIRGSLCRFLEIRIERVLVTR